MSDSKTSSLDFDKPKPRTFLTSALQMIQMILSTIVTLNRESFNWNGNYSYLTYAFASHATTHILTYTNDTNEQTHTQRVRQTNERGISVRLMIEID